MRYKLALLILLQMLMVSATLRSTDLRGRVINKSGNPGSPPSGSVGIPIGLFEARPDGTFAVVRQTNTGPNGIYYLAGVPPGAYVLQIDGVNYPLGVENAPTQDIPIITRAQNPLSEVQVQNPSLVGTWRSGKFAFTFFRNGTYAYVGAIVTPGMETRTSEKGTYTVNGDELIVKRQSGTIVASNNYSQDLKPETTVYRWRLIGRTLRLIFPGVNGGPQDFYLSE